MKEAKIIPFFTTKGGVGKTIVSLNTAVGIALKQKKTIFIDFDLKIVQETSQLLGMRCKYAINDLVPIFDKIVSGEKKLDTYVVQHSSGLHFLPAILKLRAKNDLNPEFIRKFLTFLNDEYEYIVIDVGSELTDQLITIFDLSNLIFLILTPDVISISQTGWLIDTLQSLGFPIKMLKIILNRFESKGSVSFQEIKLLFKPEIISLVPSDGKTVGLSVNRGIPFVMESPQVKISSVINQLCSDLVQNESLYVHKKELSEIRTQKIKEEKPESFLEKLNVGMAEVKLKEEGDGIIRLKRKVHLRLLDEIDLKKIPVETMVLDVQKSFELREKAEKIVANIIAEEAGGFISSAEVRQKVIREILDEALGLGPLEDLIKDQEVTEIMVNNRDNVYIERAGKLELTTKKFTSDEQVRIIIERILAPLGRRIDESSPYVDARLPDGSRVNAIIHPLSLTGPTLTIRKFSRERLTIGELVEKYGSLNKEMAVFLEAAVKSRKNILVSGGTGSGKTTFLNILSEFIPDTERIVTIEDSAELKLHHQHWIRLESKPANIEGKGGIGMREIFRNTLRMRPDRIIVGECRGQEVIDMLQAMNTGHDGSMSTIHANSTRDVLIRLDSMILMSGVELPIRAIREIISSALDMVVHTARLSDGSRKITSITEVCGMLDDINVDMREIFVYKQRGLGEHGKVIGDYSATGNIPTFYDEIISRGINLPKEIFSKSS